MPIFNSQNISKKPESIEHWVKDTYLHGIQAQRQLRDDSRKWFDLVMGDMIPDDIEEQLKDAGMPALKLNIVLPKILRIKGAERATRAGVKAVPLTQGRNDTAKVLTQLFEMIRVNSDGHREIARAFDDACIGDLGGWLEVVWTNDNDPLGQPIYRRVNPFYVVWDIKGQRYDLSDTRWIMKTWFASRDDVIRDFPDKAKEIRESLDETDNSSSWLQDWWERARGSRESIDMEFFDRKEDLYRVIECQKREEVRELRLYDPQTQSVERPDDKDELEALKLQNPRFIEVDFKWDKIRVITTVGGERLKLQDTDADVQNGMYSLIPIWGYLFGDRSFGIVKNLDGPQELYWKETSSALHMMNTASNPIWMVPRDSMTREEIEDLKKWGSRAGYVLQYDLTQGQKPSRDTVQLNGAGQLQLADRAKFIADDVSGIGPNAVGQADNSSESGELVKTRVAETMAMIENLFDNKMQSEILLHYYLIAMIQSKMPGMRILRYIGGDRNPQQVIVNQITVHGILNDLKQGEYGIAIEKGEAQYYRQEKFMKLLALAKLIGPTPELIEMMVDTFDELDEGDKQKIIQGFQMQTLEPELARMEQELRGQAAEDQKMLQAGQQAENDAVEKQMDALERLTEKRAA